MRESYPQDVGNEILETENPLVATEETFSRKEPKGREDTIVKRWRKAEY